MFENNNRCGTRAFFGFMFEDRVSSSLEQLDDMKVYKSLKFYSADLGKFVEIDILIVSSKGIFCLEVKRNSRFIKGGIDDRFWICSSGFGINKIFNPNSQNELHIRTIRKYLRYFKLPVLKIENFIILPDTTDITSNCDNVLTLSQFRLNYLLRDRDSIDYVNTVKIFKDLFRRGDIYV